jgi:hypothetical protein
MIELTHGTKELLRLLARGAGWCNYWGGERVVPIWWKNNPPPIPEHWDAVYFSVNPRTTRLGGYRRGGIADVVKMNCLYADFDKKLGAELDDIYTLKPEPSAVVHTGGGWHAYWIFSSTSSVDDDRREKLNQIQHRWVEYVGADPGAADLARVLRVPGSVNLKYAPPVAVELVKFEPLILYTLRDLEALVPERKKNPQDGWKADTHSGNGNLGKSDPDYWLNRALAMARYSGRNHSGFWLACQLRDHGFTQQQAEQALERYQKHVHNGNHPYTSKEAKDSVTSAYRAARREKAVKV